MVWLALVAGTSSTGSKGTEAARTGVRRKGVEMQNALHGRKGSQINAVRKDMLSAVEG